MMSKAFCTRMVVLFFACVTPVFSAELPKDLKWETNDSEPVYADPSAVKGGTVRLPMSTFPLTLRTEGPDANTVLYLALVNAKMGLTLQHPNTDGFVPLIATHWAKGKDGKTVYYKLNPEAVWSDGKPVTGEDFAFTLEFMRSKNLVAPWYNSYYSETYDRVVVFDPHTIAVVMKSALPPILYYADLPPTPKHYYGGTVDKDFVKKYNWSVAPTPGPYEVTKVDKGKSVTFERKKNWWGEKLKYVQNRFNVDKIIYTVVREDKLEKDYFLAEKLDFYAFLEPKTWHEFDKEKAYQKGYVERLWTYTDTLRPSVGISMNQKFSFLADKNVRLGIQHAMNWERVINTILRKEYRRLNSVGEGSGDYANKDVKAYNYDLAKADEYFKKAGFEKRGADGIRTNKDGVRLAVSVMYASDTVQPWLVVLREDAKKAGFELNMKKLDWAAVVKAMTAKKYEMVFMSTAGYKYPEYWQFFHSKSDDNLTNVNIPKLDELSDQYRIESNEKRKQEISREIQQMVHDDAAYIPAIVKDWLRSTHYRWWRYPKVPVTKNAKSNFSFFDLQYGGMIWFDQKIYDETQAAMKSNQTFTPVTRVDETWRPK